MEARKTRSGANALLREHLARNQRRTPQNGSSLSGLSTPTSAPNEASQGRRARSNENRLASRVPWRLYALIAALATITGSMVAYGTYVGVRLNTVYSPLIDTTVEIKLNTTLARVMFEQASISQKQAHVDLAWRHFGQAKRCVAAILTGGVTPAGTLAPFEDEEARRKVSYLRSALDDFAEMARAKLRHTTQPTSSGTLEDRYQAISATITDAADAAKLRFQQLAAVELSRFLVAQSTLATVGVLISLLVGIVFYQTERFRRKALLETQTANDGLQEEVAIRLRAERALQESEALYHSLVEHLPQHIFRKDLAGRFLFANQPFCRSLQRDLHEIIGRTDADFYPAELATKYASDDRQVVQTGQILSSVEEHQVPDGQRLCVHVVKTPVHSLEGEVIGVQGIFWDITEQRQAEEERRRLEDQVRYAQKLESLGVLAGGIAHDFNNLLQAILGNVELAMLGLPEESAAHGELERARTAALRSADLANQMLAYSGRGKFIVQPLSLSQLVQEMAGLLEVSISKKVTITYCFADQLPPIEGDVVQIRQVIMNLITNAAEAIGDNQGAIEVSTGTVRAGRGDLSETCFFLDEHFPEGDYVFLQVDDSGCGMDQETLEKMFDPFFTRKLSGRGLGLAAVLGIVRGHRGAVDVDSQVGKGTRFRVLLPPGQTVANVPTESTNVADTPAATTTDTGTVLVVDDEYSVREVARQMLQRAGFDVLTAGDGQEAVEIFRAHAQEIVAVLLDMKMPKMNGIEAYEEMRQIQPDACVILSSGYTEQEATSRLQGKGLAGFIQKPYSPRRLLETVRSVLAR